MNFNFNSAKNIFLAFFTLLLLPLFIFGLIFLGEANIAHGQLPPGAIGVLGGKLLGVIQCTCNGGHVMIIGPPRPARVRRVPGFTKVYEYGQVKKIGAWQLGIYAPPTVCLRRVGKICVPVPHQGNIMIIGTSR